MTLGLEFSGLQRNDHNGGSEFELWKNNLKKKKKEIEETQLSLQTNCVYLCFQADGCLINVWAHFWSGRVDFCFVVIGNLGNFGVELQPFNSKHTQTTRNILIRRRTFEHVITPVILGLNFHAFCSIHCSLHFGSMLKLFRSSAVFCRKLLKYMKVYQQKLGTLSFAKSF